MRKRKTRIAVLVCFDTKRSKFVSASERNRFYWGLYGRKQVIVKKEKRYEYYRGGLLEEIPHIKVDSSVFIIAERYLKKLMNYFRMWREKVEVKTYPVLIDEKEAKKLVEIEIE